MKRITVFVLVCCMSFLFFGCNAKNVTEKRDSWQNHATYDYECTMQNINGSQKLVATVNSPSQFVGAMQTMSASSSVIRLSCDLNFSSNNRDFIPANIGAGVILDGCGHTIYNATINLTTNTTTGFITTNEGTIQNLTLHNITIRNTNSSNIYGVGGIVGRNSGTIKNCTITGSTVYTSSGVLGGIVGYNRGEISGCTNMAKISTSSNSTTCAQYIGGVAGYMEEETAFIKNCFNFVDIDVNTKRNDCVYVGGIVGCNKDSGSSISYCLNDANIKLTNATKTRSQYSGGIVGNSYGKIENCANMGDVYSKSNASVCYAGGIVGQCAATIETCFSSGKISAYATETVSELSELNNIGSCNFADDKITWVEKNTVTNKINITNLANYWDNGYQKVITGSGNISQNYRTTLGYTGGISGNNQGNIINNCYFDGSIETKNSIYYTYKGGYKIGEYFIDVTGIIKPKYEYQYYDLISIDFEFEYEGNVRYYDPICPDFSSGDNNAYTSVLSTKTEIDPNISISGEGYFFCSHSQDCTELGNDGSVNINVAKYYSEGTKVYDEAVKTVNSINSDQVAYAMLFDLIANNTDDFRKLDEIYITNGYEYNESNNSCEIALTLQTCSNVTYSNNRHYQYSGIIDRITLNKYSETKVFKGFHCSSYIANRYLDMSDWTSNKNVYNGDLLPTGIYW